MSKPEDIPQDVRSDAAHAGITIRMALAEIAPHKAATLWATSEVISTMNATIARAILTERERGQRQLFWLMCLSMKSEGVTPFYGFGAERPHGLFTEAEWTALVDYDETVMSGEGGA